MKGVQLFKTQIPGEVCTNGNKEVISRWRMTLDTILISTSPPLLQTRRISVQIKFWLSEKRLYKLSGNDLDNLSKPILDSMKRIGMIHDDDQIYHLEATKYPTKGFEEIEIIVRDWN